MHSCEAEGERRPVPEWPWLSVELSKERDGMLQRELEPEAMDTAEEAEAYDTMDHCGVNQLFVNDLLDAVARRGLMRDDRLRVLDIGSGPATIPVILCQAAPSCTVMAVDLAAHMLRAAQRHVTTSQLEHRIFLQQASVSALPFRDASFDVVISNSLIHHLPHPPIAFPEMHRVLRPGGVMFVRDLIRPDSNASVEALTQKHAGHETDVQRGLFEASLRASLTLDELHVALHDVGLGAASLTQTSDRHWTLVGTR